MRVLGLGAFAGFNFSFCASVSSAEDFDATTETVGRDRERPGHAGQSTRHARRNAGRTAGHAAECAGVESRRQTARDRRADARTGRRRSGDRKNPATRCASRGRQTHEPAPIVARSILNPDEKAQLSFTGLIFSPDGSRIYLANVNGDIKVFGVGTDHKVSPLFSLPLPPANAPDRAGGNSRRHRRFAGRQKTLCRGQSFQSPRSNWTPRPGKFCGRGTWALRLSTWFSPAKKFT